MRIVSKKWIFDNLNSSSNVNLAVSGTVKNIIKDIKKNKDEASSLFFLISLMIFLTVPLTAKFTFEEELRLSKIHFLLTILIINLLLVVFL